MKVRDQLPAAFFSNMTIRQIETFIRPKHSKGRGERKKGEDELIVGLKDSVNKRLILIKEQLQRIRDTQTSASTKTPVLSAHTKYGGNFLKVIYKYFLLFC